MDFSEQKKQCLSKVDKSKKGEIDEGIKELVDIINSKDNYYTTSSCSGRINIMERASEKKYDCNWIIVKHDSITLSELKKSLNIIPKHQVWFRQEPMILHICCKTIDDAASLVNSAKPIFKRAGIITTGKRIIVEIIGSDFMDTIIADKGKLLVSDEYLAVLVEEGNKKLGRNKKSIDRLYLAFKLL